MSPLRRRVATAVALGIASTASLSLVPAEAATPAARYEQGAFAATNKHRVRHDRVKLKGQACVKRFAVRQARRMARQQRMFHQDLGRVMRRCDLTRAGENVAYAYPTGKAVVDLGWMLSEGHRANILNPEYRLMAVGARKGDDGRWYAAQVFGRK